MMLKIESRQNEKFKYWLELTKGKGIKKEGFLIVAGDKLCQELIREKQFNIEAELILFGNKPLTNEIKKHFYLSPELFHELDLLGTKNNLLVINTPSIPVMDLTLPVRGLEIVCPISDPSNLGAIIRSAVAFNVQKIILTKESANPFLQKAIKASSGYALKAPLFFSNQSILELSFDDENTFALDMNGTDIRDIQFGQNMRFVLGQEGLGIPKNQNLKKIKIPTVAVESLNVAVATSIVLFHHSSSQKK